MMAKKGEPESICLSDRLKEKGLEPLYLVEGKEAFLRKRAVEELRTFAGPNPAETRFEGSKAQLSQVLDELRTLPFLASVRMVFIDEAEEFLAKNGEGLEKALQEVTRFKKTALVLETDGLDARFKLSKLVRELAVRITCDTPDELAQLEARVEPIGLEDEGRLLETSDLLERFLETLAVLREELLRLIDEDHAHRRQEGERSELVEDLGELGLAPLEACLCRVGSSKGS